MVLVPKKSVALQARRRLSVDVAPVLGGGGASATVSPANEAPLTVAPVPLVGQVGAGAEGAPSKVTEQPVMELILLPMSGQMDLLLALVAPTAVSAALPVEAPSMQAEVAATMIS